MNDIAQQSMIVNLEFGLPRQGEQLKDEGKKIEQENHAQAGTVRPPGANFFRRKADKTKGEVGNFVDGLEILKDVQTEYKKRVYELARYPYAAGWQLAPANVIPDLLSLQEMFEGKKDEKGKVIGFGSRMAQAWMKWCTEVYPEWKSTASARLGELFDPELFPTLADCKQRFTSKLTILPIAPKDQVARITLISPAHHAMLKQHADEAQAKAIAEMRAQIWKDIMEPIQQIVTVFSKDKFKVYETLLGNLMSIVNVVPAYNDVLGDPNLAKIAQEAKDVFSKMTTDDLRKSDEHRKVALATAKKLVAEFDPFAREFTETE